MMDLGQLAPLTDRLTAGYLEYYGLLPLARHHDRVDVATWRDPVDGQALDDLRLAFGAPIALINGPEADLRAAIRRTYGGMGVTAERVIAELPDGPGATISELPLDDLVHLANEAPVVKLVNLLLLEALEARASDVHLEAYANGLKVRYRIDGVLQDAPSPPANLAAPVVSRLKIMADLDVAERRVPQDGRIRLTLQGRQVDVRVSTVPILHGESVVLRLLDKDQSRSSLAELGMAPDTLALFDTLVAQPHGIVLATGPTGSGKTTTLYAALDRLRTGREKIVTVEDPIEYELAGVVQVPVNEKVGVSFGTALRALLRQDPDVMLVGEIRDRDTAEVATHAALTGHLVLSTLHTNDAPSALTRLIDLGVASYLVASTVEGVLAQRLVRLICEHCRRPVAAPVGLRDILGATVWEGAGCAECRQTGFRGRAGIYELLRVDDRIREALSKLGSAGELRRIAVAAGMRSLRDDGWRVVREGRTTIDEVIRVTAV